jgi:hypothetical protein
MIAQLTPLFYATKPVSLQDTIVNAELGTRVFAERIREESLTV